MSLPSPIGPTVTSTRPATKRISGGACVSDEPPEVSGVVVSGVVDGVPFGFATGGDTLVSVEPPPLVGGGVVEDVPFGFATGGAAVLSEERPPLSATFCVCATPKCWVNGFFDFSFARRLR